MQRKKLLNLLAEYCNEQGSKTFSLKQLNERYQDYSVIGITGKTPQATVRRLLQELRDKDDLLSFLPKKGFYTLGGEKLDFLLDEEKEELSNIDLSKETNKEKIEHIRETYFRSTKIVKLAKEVLGTNCLYPKCHNTFLKEDKSPYIEVHHIVPLHKKGIDKIENLSVVCAHHHKMSHFADIKTKIAIEKILTKETMSRL
ncbi:MAG: HNH endonuclease [Gammaproteobacteria bacterium]|nr:HNH endonuclease [Gammaproteobacteria bacterium]